MNIYPCTIVPARYGGTYEGGAWLAFFIDADRLPDGYNASDVECAEFWFSDLGKGVGKGNTPQEAYDNLCQIKKPLQDEWDQTVGEFVYELKEWPGYVRR